VHEWIIDDLLKSSVKRSIFWSRQLRYQFSTSEWANRWTTVHTTRFYLPFSFRSSYKLMKCGRRRLLWLVGTAPHPIGSAVSAVSSAAEADCINHIGQVRQQPPPCTLSSPATSAPYIGASHSRLCTRLVPWTTDLGLLRYRGCPPNILHLTPPPFP